MANLFKILVIIASVITLVGGMAVVATGIYLKLSTVYNDFWNDI